MMQFGSTTSDELTNSSWGTAILNASIYDVISILRKLNRKRIRHGPKEDTFFAQMSASIHAERHPSRTQMHRSRWWQQAGMYEERQLLAWVL
jgi:hypothetical protein